MKQILICGANGQLGKSIQDIVSNEQHYICTDKSTLDITNKVALKEFIKQHNIAVIVNCVAYTAVDNAEEDFENANLLNHIAVQNLAEICSTNNIFLIHISTDYIFDGNRQAPYNEMDTPNPQTVYGRTKLAGEMAIQEQLKHFLILRTSWLYSNYGANFVRTILKASQEKNTLRVVNDQIGTPTNASDLAQFIIDFITQKWYQKHSGIYHFSNEGVCSWYDFAKELMVLSENTCKIIPCKSTEYPTKAKRPNYSVLDKTKLKMDFSYTIPTWQSSLRKFYTTNSKQ